MCYMKSYNIYSYILLFAYHSKYINIFINIIIVLAIVYEMIDVFQSVSYSIKVINITFIYFLPGNC